MENDELEKYLEKLFAVLESVGMSQKESEEQIAGLGELISTRMLLRAAEDNPQEKQRIVEEPGKFLKEKYSEQEIAKLVQEESEQVIKPYFEKILVNYSDEQKAKILTKL